MGSPTVPPGIRATLGAIATTGLVTIDRQAPLVEAARLMTSHHITAVVVVDARQAPVGVVSQSDIVRAESGIDDQARAIGAAVRVGEVMSPALLALRASCPVAVAARLMAGAKIHRVLVTDEAGDRCLGVATALDVMKVLGERGLGGEPPIEDADLYTYVDLRSPRDLFAASWTRCCATPSFAQTFAHAAYDGSPELRAVFAATPSPIAALARSLEFAVEVALGKATSLAQLRERARLHDRDHHDVAPALYERWLDALLGCVRARDREYSLAVDHAWRLVLGNVIAAMVKHR